MTATAVSLNPARKHQWDRAREQRIARCADGNDRTERPCICCGMWKITVHAPDRRLAWREWRTADGKVWQGEATPPCIEGSKAA